jgi:hypothetical protein
VQTLTITVPDLENVGPVLDVQLSSSQSGQQALTQRALPVPGPLSVRALIDTGSDMCALDVGLAQALGLTLIGVQFLGGGFAGGSTSSLTPVPEYSASLLFPHGVLLDVTVIEVPLPGGLQLLIGRDVLAKGYFGYDGLGNSFTLSL